MGNYYLCVTGRAQHPYYIENIRMHIWSIEELCYYMWNNVYLIDETVLNEKLCRWLETELGLKRLAMICAKALEKGAPAEEFVLPIFKECGYVSQAQLIYFKEQLMQVQIEPRSVRQKMKADYLVQYGMYVRAVEEYQAILEKRSPGRLGIQFYATVLENMATAYARLFLFEEAAYCLWDSYQTLRSRKVYEKYLRLLPLFLSEQAYREKLEEIKADRALAADMRADTLRILREGQESDFAREWAEKTEEEQIALLKRQYMEQTRN